MSKKPLASEPLSAPNRIVKCPNCGEDSIYSSENPHRPFCSARCRGIDLVKWADENYKIPVQKNPFNDSHSEDDYGDESDRALTKGSDSDSDEEV